MAVASQTEYRRHSGPHSAFPFQLQRPGNILSTNSASLPVASSLTKVCPCRQRTPSGASKHRAEIKASSVQRVRPFFCEPSTARSHFAHYCISQKEFIVQNARCGETRAATASFARRRNGRPVKAVSCHRQVSISYLSYRFEGSALLAFGLPARPPTSCCALCCGPLQAIACVHSLDLLVSPLFQTNLYRLSGNHALSLSSILQYL